MTVGENIKQYRLKKGLTQKQLSSILGLAEITIRQYEGNKREPSFKRLYEIAEILDISVTDLMNKDDFNKAYENAFNESLDKDIYNNMKTFFSLGDYILKKEKDSTFSIYKKYCEKGKEQLVLSNLDMVDLQDMETWIPGYVRKVVDCITQMKTNPDYVIQPYDPPYYPNEEHEDDKRSSFEDISNTSIPDELKEQIEKYAKYTFYDMQKELDARKKRSSKKTNDQ